ncbi:MAG: HIT domain-containing protein [Neomegalonema sp.]|nr:HIT domain-containing protein [Neomegalonema sp.]
MAYEYDPENVFAKILRGDLPCTKVHETEHTLAFNDINPVRPVHVLVIPKGPYVTYDDFTANASDAEIVDLFRVIGMLTRQLKVSAAGDGEGYRLITNAGEHGVQEVPHFHMHIIGGAGCGPMIKRDA